MATLTAWVLPEAGAAERAVSTLGDLQSQAFASNLSSEDEAKLREAFAEDEA